jgi:cation transport regulator ChaC
MTIQPETLCILYHILVEQDAKFRKMRKEAQQPVYYFAYGSTMNQQWFETKVGKVEFVCKAVLKDFELHFSKTSHHKSAKANLIPSENSFVEGAIYKITRGQLKQLDQSKGYPHQIERTRFFVKQDNLSPDILAHAHHISFNQKHHDYAPESKYLELMLVGAKKIGVSKKYYQHLLQAQLDTSQFQKSKL